MRLSSPTVNVAIVIVPMPGGKFIFVEEVKEACKGLWSLPGGVVEKGESIADAAVREVAEEAGVVVEPTGILRVEHQRFVTDQATPYERFRFIVVARYLSGVLKKTADAESGRADVFTFQDAESLPFRPGYDLTWLQRMNGGAPLMPIDSYHFSVV